MLKLLDGLLSRRVNALWYRFDPTEVKDSLFIHRFFPSDCAFRQLSKSVAIVSMRNSCSQDFITRKASLRDFSMIWLEEIIQDLLAPRERAASMSKDLESRLIESITAQVVET